MKNYFLIFALIVNVARFLQSDEILYQFLALYKELSLLSSTKESDAKKSDPQDAYLRKLSILTQKELAELFGLPYKQWHVCGVTNRGAGYFAMTIEVGWNSIVKIVSLNLKNYEEVGHKMQLHNFRISLTYGRPFHSLRGYDNRIILQGGETNAKDLYLLDSVKETLSAINDNCLSSFDGTTTLCEKDEIFTMHRTGHKLISVRVLVNSDGCKMSEDGSRIAVLESNGYDFTVYDSVTGSIIITTSKKEKSKEALLELNISSRELTALAISLDGRFVAVACKYRNSNQTDVVIVDIDAKKEVVRVSWDNDRDCHFSQSKKDELPILIGLLEGRDSDNKVADVSVKFTILEGMLNKDAWSTLQPGTCTIDLFKENKMLDKHESPYLSFKTSPDGSWVISNVRNRRGNTNRDFDVWHIPGIIKERDLQKKVFAAYTENTQVRLNAEERRALEALHRDPAFTIPSRWIRYIEDSA